VDHQRRALHPAHFLMSSLPRYYKILGLEPGASSEAVKQAYRALAKQWHPDSIIDNPALKQQAEERFKQISEAYEILKHELSGTDLSDNRQRSSKTSRRPTNPADYYESGAENVREGLYEEAIADFTIAIRLNPYYGEAYRYRGHVNSLLGFERRAAADLEKAAFLLGEPPTSQETSSPPQKIQDVEPAKQDSPPEPQQPPTACVHNPGPWRCTQTFSDALGEVRAIALSRDSRFLALGSDHAIRLYNLRTGRLLCTLTGHSDIVRSVAFSQDGQLLASASQDCTIKLWHFASGSLLKTLTGHTDGVTAIALSPDRQTVVSGSLDGSVRFWQTHSGELLHTRYGQAEPIRAVAISPDGQTVFAGGDGKTIKLYHLKTGEFSRALPMQRAAIEAIALSPDGQYAVTAGSDGEMLRWALETGRPEQVILGHAATLRAVAWSGQTLASGGDDHSVRVWNVRQLEDSPWVLLKHTAPVTSLVCSADSQVIISGSLDQTVSVWDSSPAS
jgi:COMPASS component SWD3